MNVYLIQATPFPEQLCGAAAAVCTNTEDYEKSLKHALASGHTSFVKLVVRGQQPPKSLCLLFLFTSGTCAR